MKIKVMIGLIIVSSLTVFSQKATLISPNQKITLELYNSQNAELGEWYLKVKYTDQSKTSDGILRDSSPRTLRPAAVRRSSKLMNRSSAMNGMLKPWSV